MRSVNKSITNRLREMINMLIRNQKRVDVKVVVEVVVKDNVVVEIIVDVINIVVGCGLVTTAAHAWVSTTEPNGTRSRGVTVATGATVIVRLAFRLFASTTARVVCEVVVTCVAVVVALTVIVEYPRYPEQKLCKFSAMMIPSATFAALVLIMDTISEVMVTMLVVGGSVVSTGVEAVLVKVLTDTTIVFTV